jgi:hypothetical protein
MRSGPVVLGVLTSENSLPISMHLMCSNGLDAVVFQGTAQLAGSVISGSLASTGGGNCSDPSTNTWHVSVVMSKP